MSRSDMSKIEGAILRSYRHAMAVSIKLKGEAAFVTAVQKYIDKGSLKLVELKPETLYGKPIRETVIHLSEIESVVPLYVSYDNPVYVKLRKIKKLINEI